MHRRDPNNEPQKTPVPTGIKEITRREQQMILLPVPKKPVRQRNKGKKSPELITVKNHATQG